MTKSDNNCLHRRDTQIITVISGGLLVFYLKLQERRPFVEPHHVLGWKRRVMLNFFQQISLW